MRLSRLTGSVIALAVVGCADERGPADAALAPPAEGVPTLNLYGAHGFAGGRRQPCAQGRYRDFDFWVGDWNVTDDAGTQIGTNAVTIEADGCIVAEHWTDAQGGRGRSINTFDSETGQWHQTWVTQFTLGHLRMAGGLVDGVMVMSGERNSVFGFPFFDEYTWTELDDGRVLQTGLLEIPAIDLRSEFRGFYERTDDLTPAEEAPGLECSEPGISARSRELDFLVGSWSVWAFPGLRIGESEVTTDLSGCLIEERFDGGRGYEAVSFTYFDRAVGQFHRTYIDSEAERVETAGDFVDGNLVLTGVERLLGRDWDVRVTFEMPSEDRLRKTVALSRDDGVHWITVLRLSYRRS